MGPVCCLLVLLLCLPVCTGETQQTVFSSSGQEDVTINDDLLATLDAMSDIDCARRCSITKECVTFTFTKGSPTGTCRLHSGMMTSYCPSSPVSGSKTYRTTHETGVDRCAAENSVCDQTCTSTGSSFTCGCNPGYELDKCNEKTCYDIDECAAGTSGCDQTCSNTVGSFTCGCNPGYVLNDDGRTCEEVCGEQPDSEGWTVFQRRQDGSVDFFRDWTDYVNGFGIPGGECWLGLETVYNLTLDGNWTLRVDLGDWEGNMSFATYTGFYITNSTDDYRLMFDAGSYSGDAGDSLTGWPPGNDHRGRTFSTRDHGTRTWCAGAQYYGAWWFAECFAAHLNGQYKVNGTTTSAQGIIWFGWKGWDYSLKFTEMKLKRVV